MIYVSYAISKNGHNGKKKNIISYFILYNMQNSKRHIYTIEYTRTKDNVFCLKWCTNNKYILRRKNTFSLLHSTTLYLHYIYVDYNKIINISGIAYIMLVYRDYYTFTKNYCL